MNLDLSRITTNSTLTLTEDDIISTNYISKKNKEQEYLEILTPIKVDCIISNSLDTENISCNSIKSSNDKLIIDSDVIIYKNINCILTKEIDKISDLSNIPLIIPPNISSKLFKLVAEYNNATQIIYIDFYYNPTGNPPFNLMSVHSFSTEHFNVNLKYDKGLICSTTIKHKGFINLKFQLFFI